MTDRPVRVVVTVKQVALPGDEFKLNQDGSGVDPDELDRALNEWDACAVEEALRLRERGSASEVVALTLGGPESEDALRSCLAMGVDRALRIDGAAIDPISIARALADVIREQSPDLVLAGAQSADSTQGATGSAIAGLLGLPVVAVVKRLEWENDGTVVVHRELEGGLVDVVEVDLPAVLTIQTGINEPRYANLRAIRRAESVDIEVLSDVETESGGYRVRTMFAPARGGRATMIDGGAPDVARRIVELVRERRG